MDARLLQLFQRETTSQSQLRVVPQSRTGDNRSEPTDRSRGQKSGLFHSFLVSSLLPHRLIEPEFDVPLPVLMEVAIGHNVVPLGRHFLGSETTGTSMQGTKRLTEEDAEPGDAPE